MIGKVSVVKIVLMANLMHKYYLLRLLFYLRISLDFKLSPRDYHYVLL